jgi:putative transposase
LEECAARYRGFCKKYKPKPKSEKKYHWGSRLLPKLVKGKKNKNKVPPGQMKLPWGEWEVPDSKVREVALYVCQC